MAAVNHDIDKSLPVRRRWITAKRSASEGDDVADSFVVVSYNILADCHVTSETYPYLPRGYRTMEERHPQLMMELNHHGDADVICLQEVNSKYFKETLAPALSDLGYDGVQCNKALGIDEGSATFYRKSRFEVETQKVVYFKDQIQEYISRRPCPLPSGQSEAILERTLKETVTMFLQLRCKKTGKVLALGNIHPFWKNDLVMDVITLQIAFAINTLAELSGGASNALILCGDFNTEPSMPAYQLLQDGRLSDQSVKTLHQFGTSAKNDSDEDFTLIDVMSECFHHPVHDFQSAYKTIMGSEIPFSQFHDTVGSEWKERNQTGVQTQNDDIKHRGRKIKALDYLWFSSLTLGCDGVLEMVAREILDSLYACPNRAFPSDHLLMKSRFHFK